MECVSPLSSCIPQYVRTQMFRACKMKSDEWNATAKFAIEHNEKFLNNQLAEVSFYMSHVSFFLFD